MSIKLTLEEFEQINENLIVEDNGNTNKKCPCCGNDVIVEYEGASYIIRCSNECFSITSRGI